MFVEPSLTSANSALLTASSLAEAVGSIDFWLDKPLRITFIVVGAMLISMVVRSIIKHITGSIAGGTHTRIIPGGRGVGRWIQDTGLSNARQAQRAKTVGSVLRSVASIVIWAMAIVMVIAELGFNIAPVLASAGVVGVALSFGAQSLVKDYLTGIFIVAEDQLGIGDWVDLGEATGEVEAVGLRTTQVRDVNGTLWHVRNGEILRVGNSSQGWARTNIDMPVPYDANIEQVSAILLEAASKAVRRPELKDHVVGAPEVRGVEKVSGESLTIRITVKTAPSEQWAVARVLRVELKQALDAAGYRIPLLNQSLVRSADQNNTVIHHTTPTPGSTPTS